MRLGLGIGIGFVRGRNGSPDWVLENGLWLDGGFWFDSEIWNGV